MQIKTQYYFTSVKMSIKKKKLTNIGKDVDNGTLAHWQCAVTIKSIMEVPKKLKIKLPPYDSANPFLGIYVKELNLRERSEFPHLMQYYLQQPRDANNLNIH